MTEQSNPPVDRAVWSVERFERFWAKPDPALVPATLPDDVVGHWAGRDEPVRGKQPYTNCIAALVEALPGVSISAAEHASSAEFTFVRWIMHAVGENGPFELTGINLVRTRDGLVTENWIVLDTAAFKTRSGQEIPWA
jgi:hypothetical protein